MLRILTIIITIITLFNHAGSSGPTACALGTGRPAGIPAGEPWPPSMVSESGFSPTPGRAGRFKFARTPTAGGPGQTGSPGIRALGPAWPGPEPGFGRAWWLSRPAAAGLIGGCGRPRSDTVFNHLNYILLNHAAGAYAGRDLRGRRAQPTAPGGCDTVFNHFYIRKCSIIFIIYYLTARQRQPPVRVAPCAAGERNRPATQVATQSRGGAAFERCLSPCRGGCCLGAAHQAYVHSAPGQILWA